MATPAAALKDFFISYNKADKAWAEWIAWQLKETGYTVLIQACPGSDFILEMDKAVRQTRRTIAVLSPAYLNALYTQPEWAAALLRDPTGSKRLLVPVRVHKCKPQGLLAPVVYIDFVGLNEAVARERLLSGVLEDGTPTTAPHFSKKSKQPKTQPPAFPGPGQQPTHEVLWLVPHRRNPYFTGRDETLEQLHATFTAKSGIVIQALTGLGGIGKTQTALEYACRSEQAYQAVFWVRAETRELLTGDLLTIATRLQLPECQAQEQAVVVAAVTR